MNDAPPAENVTEPLSLFPAPPLGVLKRHEATPLAALAVPFTFTAPVDAAQRTRVGLTAEPPFVTRTDATTVEPALGFAGESLTALAVALDVSP